MKDSPVVITDIKITYLKTLNERDRRRFLACKATGPMKVAVKRLAGFLKVGKNTIYKGIREPSDNIDPGEGRIRRLGGGAKSKISLHPEWVAAFQDIISHHMAGLPQDEGTVWLDQTKRMVRESFRERLAKQVVFDNALHRWNYSFSSNSSISSSARYSSLRQCKSATPLLISW